MCQQNKLLNVTSVMLFVTIGGKTVKCSLGEEFLKDYADIYALEDLLAAVGQGFIGFVKDKIADGKIKTVEESE